MELYGFVVDRNLGDFTSHLGENLLASFFLVPIGFLVGAIAGGAGDTVAGYKSRR